MAPAIIIHGNGRHFRYGIKCQFIEGKGIVANAISINGADRHFMYNIKIMMRMADVIVSFMASLPPFLL